MAFNDIDSESNLGADAQFVIRLFNSGNDAQQAIGELREQGFSTRQIGAAFRGSSTLGGSDSSSRFAPSQARTDLASEELGSFNRISDRSHDASDESSTRSVAGPASGTAAVTPAGLSTGSGMTMSGAGRPGPIPGSEIPHHRSAESVESSEDLRDDDASYNRQESSSRFDDFSSATLAEQRLEPLPAVSYPVPQPADRDEVATHDDSWWEKIKRFFTDDDAKAESDAGFARSGDSDRERNADSRSKSANDFGTGEGDLGLSESSRVVPQTAAEGYDYAYSAKDLEGSLVSMGLSKGEAHAFIRQLGSGGAIVTVVAGARWEEAESVLERNNGREIYEEDEEDSEWVQPDAGGEKNYGRIQLFGELRRTYGSRGTVTREEDEGDFRKFA